MENLRKLFHYVKVLLCASNDLLPRLTTFPVHLLNTTLSKLHATKLTKQSESYKILSVWCTNLSVFIITPKISRFISIKVFSMETGHRVKGPKCERDFE